MIKVNKISLIVISVIFVIAVFSIQTVLGAEVQEDRDIVLGWIGPFSGNYAWAGEYLTNGSKLALDEINAVGGVKGRKIKLIWEDDGGNPTQSVNAAIKLITQDKVDLIMGPFNSSCALAVMQECANREFPNLTFGLSPLITSQGNQWVFRMSPGDNIAVKNLLDYVTEVKGWTRIAFITDTTDYGTGAYVVGEPYLKAKGLEPLTNEKFNIPDKDFTSQLLKIKQTNPDVIFPHGDEADIGLIAKQRVQLGMGHIPLIGGLPLTGKKFIENAGKEAAEGTIVVTNFIPNNNPDPLVISFTAHFKEKYGYTPEARCASGYDGTYVAAQAFRIVFEQLGGELTPENIRDGLRMVQGLKGVQGEFNYDETGEGLSTCHKGIFRNGELEFLTAE
jgi:branched-chain amino acid transport system substrate-binding protein